MKLIREYPKASRLEVRSLEEAHGIAFPDDYVEFLLTQNGGTPEANLYPGPPLRVHVSEFFPCLNGAPNNLANEIKFFRDEFRADSFPIAFDYGGNRICIGTEIENHGQVLFWNHEDAFSPLTVICGSFGELVTRLVKEDVVVDAIEELAYSQNLERVCRYLEEGNRLEVTNEMGRTLLEEASRAGNVLIASHCLANGASLRDALPLAAMNGHEDIVRLLVQHGADLEKPNRLGKRPIELASNHPSLKVYLLALGAME